MQTCSVVLMHTAVPRTNSIRMTSPPPTPKAIRPVDYLGTEKKLSYIVARRSRVQLRARGVAKGNE
jgi:hypothetical protein